MHSEVAARESQESTVWGVHRQEGSVALCPRPWALELAVWIQSHLISSMTLSKFFHFAASQL